MSLYRMHIYEEYSSGTTIEVSMPEVIATNSILRTFDFSIFRKIKLHMYLSLCTANPAS